MRATSLLTASMVFAGAAPTAATAQLPGLSSVPGVPGSDSGLTSTLTKPLLDLVFKWMFGATPDGMARKALKSLVTNPDLSSGALFAKLNQSVDQTRPIAIVLLVFFLCLGLLDSLAQDPSRAGIDVWKRFGVAVVGIVALPQLFAWVSTSIGYLTAAVVDMPLVTDTVTHGLDAAIGGESLGAVFGGFATILLTCLLIAKLVVVALLALLFVSGTIVLSTYVYGRLSHLTGVWLQSFGLLQALPIAWSLILLTFGLVGGAGTLFEGAGLKSDMTDQIVALTLLLMLLTSVPVLLRLAWVGGLIPSLKGAGRMAWGASLGSHLHGGFDAAAMGEQGQLRMDEAAAPPAATDRRGSDGPAMDWGPASTSGGAGRLPADGATDATRATSSAAGEELSAGVLHGGLPAARTAEVSARDAAEGDMAGPAPRLGESDAGDESVAVVGQHELAGSEVIAGDAPGEPVHLATSGLRSAAPGESSSTTAGETFAATSTSAAPGHGDGARFTRAAAAEVGPIDPRPTDQVIPDAGGQAVTADGDAGPESADVREPIGPTGERGEVLEASPVGPADDVDAVAEPAR